MIRQTVIMKKGTSSVRQEVGRHRIKIDLELIKQLCKLGLSWRATARQYFTLTGQEVSFMALWRFIKAELEDSCEIPGKIHAYSVDC